MPIRTLLLALIYCFATTSFAQPHFEFLGPYQFSSQSYQAVDLTNSLYERNDYDLIGSQILIGVDTFTYPEGGDSWWIALQDQDGVKLAEVYLFYDAASDCVTSAGTPVVCNIRGNIEGLDDLYFYWVSVFFGGECLPTERYEMTLEYQILGQPRKPSVKSPFSFTPTRFRPVLASDMLHLPDNLQPSLTKGGTGEAGDITVVLQDDLGCSAPVEGAEVTLTTTTVSGTNGQTYLRGGDRGTGEFLSLGWDAEVDTTSAYQGTKITGISDDEGVFRVQYQAKSHGAEEILTLEAKLPETAIEPEYIAPPLEEDLLLSVPGLVRVTTSNADVYFADLGGCPHNPLPHWLTPYSRTKMMALAASYHFYTGRYISMNDASLPLGGVIANKLKDGGGRHAACHVSHRRGVDVDINSVDRVSGGGAGEDMSTSMVNYDGREMLAVQALTLMASELRALRVREEPIHYRWPK